MKSYKKKKCLVKKRCVARKRKQAYSPIETGIAIGIIGVGAIAIFATAPLWVPAAKVKLVQAGVVCGVTALLA